MNPYTAVLAAQHLEDLQREADRIRLAKEFRRGIDEPTDRGGLSRVAARSARARSSALTSLAARIDPAEISRSTPA